jgi:hypothetical protein
MVAPKIGSPIARKRGDTGNLRDGRMTRPATMRAPGKADQKAAARARPFTTPIISYILGNGILALCAAVRLD